MFALLWLAVAAAAPVELTWQGRLLDTLGEPVQGSPSVEIRLMSRASGSGPEDPLFTELFGSVPFDDGYASVRLGAADTTLEAEDLQGGAVWVEVVVAGTVLTPRSRLSTVPYAVISSHVPVDSTALTGACTDAGAIAFDTTLGVARVCSGTEWVSLAEGAAADTCDGERFGPVCVSEIGGPSTWYGAALSCLAKGPGHRLCTTPEAVAVVQHGGFPESYPPGTNHVWVDDGEGNVNGEAIGVRNNGTNDDWVANATDGFGMCCQTVDVEPTCAGTDINGTCFLGESGTNINFATAIGACESMGGSLCSSEEAVNACINDGLPSGESWWIGHGEGDNNGEFGGMYASGCKLDDFNPTYLAHRALCCQNTLPTVDATTCPGTWSAGVCLAAEHSDLSFDAAASTCRAEGARLCRPSEAYALCQSGTPATSGPWWIAGAETNAPNQGSSMMAASCVMDGNVSTTSYSALCCR